MSFPESHPACRQNCRGNPACDLRYRELRRSAPIVVLINHGIVSNAEQFALRLSRWKWVTLAGKPSRGILAYGVEDSRRGVGCGHYTLQLATRRHSRYLPYEGSGLNLEWKLTSSRPWIDQVPGKLAT